jgi:hypothetical protein
MNTDATPSPIATPTTGTSTVSPSGSSGSSNSVLTNAQAIGVGTALSIVLILLGFGLYFNKQKDNDSSFVRSLIAISLIAGLLTLGVASLLINDTATRSTLIGALGTSAGAAVAFYFSSKANDQTAAALKSATAPQVPVPDLTTMSWNDAATALGSTALTLDFDRAGALPGTAKATIRGQRPAAGSSAASGTSIVVTLATS